MEKYKCIKVVEAEPQEKDGKPGYKVKYEDGYISWSPKEAFEKGYVKYDSYIDRLLAEWKDIHNKVEKLDNFIQNDGLTKVLEDGNAEDVHLLVLQLEAMRHYETVLEFRLFNKGIENPEDL